MDREEVVSPFLDPAGFSSGSASLYPVAQPYANAIKRVGDLAGCLVLVPLAVLFAVPVAALIMLDGASPLYRQTRVGRDGRLFSCWKFRSMVVDADARLRNVLETDPAALAEWNRDRKLKDDPRVTWLGGFLRKSSLDELPQVLNVLRGEMSLVGPRPVVPEELAEYGSALPAYLACLPGITGLWQVSGRTDTSYRERVELDARYAREWSLLLDLKILFLTLPAVLKGRGAY